MAFISQLTGKPVVDADGKSLGSLKDLIAKINEEMPHPVIDAIVIEQKGASLIVPYSYVVLMTSAIIPLNRREDEIQPYTPGDQDIFLVENVLDKQIIDTNGARVVRVNDLELVRVNGHLFVSNVDIGSMGILRRIGLAKTAESFASRFHFKMPENTISWDFVEPLLRDQYMRLKVPVERITELHPADIAEIISDMSHAESGELLDTLGVKYIADALEEVEPDFQASLIQDMSDEKVADVLEEMEPDEAADLLAELPKERSEDLLELMEDDEAKDVRKLLSYPDDSAGGLMTTEYASIKPGLTAEQAIVALRESAHEAETIFYVYVIDEENHLIGVFYLSDLIIADPHTPVENIMHHRVVSVPLLEKQDKIAQLVAKYDLLAIPVVDDQNRLHGMVTANDALDKIIASAWKRRLPRFYYYQIIPIFLWNGNMKFPLAIHLPNWRSSSLIKRIILFISVFGPATITAMADNDAGGVATYSIAGSKLGYPILFPLLIITILLGITQEMGMRLTLITRRGLADIIREKYGVKVSLIMFISLFIANMGTITVELSAVKTTSSMLHISPIPFVILIILISFIFITFGNYKLTQSIMLVSCLFYLTYVVSAFKAKPDWGLALSNLIYPHGVAWTKSYLKDYLVIGMGVLGTTITPWGQFFISSFAFDKKIDAGKVSYSQIETYWGAFLTDFFSFFMIIATAATLFTHQIPLISGEQASLAIKPFAGELAGTLFAIGILNAGFMGLVVVSLSTAYAFAEFFGLSGSLDTSYKESKTFYVLFIAQLATAAIIMLLPGVNLFQLAIFTQVINAMSLPLVFFYLIRLTSNPKIMGKYANNNFQKYFAIACTIVICITSVFTLVTVFAKL